MVSTKENKGKTCQFHECFMIYMCWIGFINEIKKRRVWNKDVVAGKLTKKW